MSQVCVFDLTLGRHIDETKDSTSTQIIDELSQIAKKWVFQGERSPPTEAHPEGFLHWQIRLSTFKKIREHEMWALKGRLTLLSHAHVSITSNDVAKAFAGRDNDAFYVMKLDSRVDGEGPFTDKEKPLFVQKEVHKLINEGLFPWQEQIVNSKDEYDARHINVIIDEKGNVGKSSLAAYLRAKRIAVCAPSMADAQDYMALVLAKEKLGMYVFDIPRAVAKRNMNSFFVAVEQIKDGYAFDKRYKFRDETFERPVVWVFSNVLPPVDCLSADRWVYWKVDPTENRLVRFKAVHPTPASGGGSAAGFLSPESMLVSERPTKRIRSE